MPEAIQDAPALQPGLEVFYNAFYTLSGSRVNGMGVGNIPWGELYSYARYLGYTGEDLEEFIYVLRKLDQAYVEIVNERSR